MGFHICEKCQQAGKLESQKNKFSTLSSGDVKLFFVIPGSGKVYGFVVPDMIKHYIGDHGWYPPEDFVECLMFGVEITEGTAKAYDSQVAVKEVGYLQLPDIQNSDNELAAEYFEKLLTYMNKSENNGQRAQTKGLSL